MRGPRRAPRPLPGGKAARNERRKLRSTSANAGGLAFVAVGVIQPLLSGDFSSPALLRIALAAPIAYMLHEFAIRLIADLED